MKIKVTHIEVQIVEHFDPDDKSLGFLNEQESTDLRCQIGENKAEGYYLMFKGEKIKINTDGRIHNWRVGLFDTMEILFARLFKTRVDLK